MSTEFHSTMDAAADALAALHLTAEDEFDFDYILEHIASSALSPEAELIWAENLLESGEIELELDIAELVALDRYLSSI